MAVCTSITQVAGKNDLLLVNIDNDVQAYWFYDYAKAQEFINKDVIVEYREDILDGNMRTFVRTFTVPTIVNTLDKKDNIKLFCDQTDNFSNFSFTEIQTGESKPACIFYCVKQEFKASDKSHWMELIIRDKLMRCAVLRIFDYDNIHSELAGHYAVAELSRNSFGFNTSMVAPVNKGECPVNPEISIARQYIMNYFSDDKTALEYINATKVLDCLEDAIDYEVGYGLVRLATELSFVDSMQNVSKDLDLRAIGEALLCKRGYMTRTSALSPIINNVFIAQNYRWEHRTTVLVLLDTMNETRIAEHSILDGIVDMVSTILEARKGIVY